MKLFSHVSLSRGEFFGSFFVHFWVSLHFYVPLFPENHSIASHTNLIFCTHISCITLTFNVPRKISQHVFFCLGNYVVIFGPVFGIFLNLLRNLKHSFDILHECFVVTLMVSTQENVLDLLLLLTFRCFWSMLYYFPQIVRNYEAFSSEFLFNFLFQNIK